jgi:hypothetical protein
MNKFMKAGDGYCLTYIFEPRAIALTIYAKKSFFYGYGEELWPNLLKIWATLC